MLHLGVKPKRKQINIYFRKEVQNKEEVKETKEINEERKLDVLKRRIDVLLESQATIMNAIGSVICMSEIKDEDIKMKMQHLEI